MDRDDVLIRLARRVGTAIALMCAVASTTTNAQQMDCSQVKNARDRLACFDRFFPRDPSKPAVAPVPTEPVKDSAPVYSTPDEVTTPPSPDADPTAVPAEVKDERGLKKSRGIFDLPEKVEISSVIAAVRSDYPRKMVFRLENGQIWMQSSPRELPIREGDEVTIKSATIGGYILRTSSGTSTRVQRIE